MPASHLGDERKAPAAIAAAANAQRLQYALKGLCLWEDEEGKDEGQRRGNRRTLMKGSSPPGFVLSMTARWPGCQTLCSFTAADLGSRVALWIVESPVDPPAMVVYHPKKQKYSTTQPQLTQAVSCINCTVNLRITHTLTSAVDCVLLQA